MRAGTSIQPRPGFVILFLASLALPPSWLHAQRIDIRGVVVDSITNQRLPYANVVIKGTNKGAATNANGFYLIAGVPTGTYEISASYIGYKSQTLRVSARGLDPIVLNFALRLSTLETEEVVVTARRRPELNEINPSIHVLDQGDISMVPVTVQPDLFRSLQILPGIASTSDVSSQFYVRGGAGDQNLILLDGMKIYSPYHAFGVFSTCDPAVMRTTEVYTGAFPAGFGGRLSSVVNITSRDGRSDRLAGRANMNFLATNALLEGSSVLSDEATWLLSVRKSLFSKSFTKFFRQDTPVFFYDGFGKLSMPRADRGKLSFQGLLSGDDLVSERETDPDYRWRNSAISMTGSGLIAERLYVDAIAFGTQFEAERDAKTSTRITSTSTSVKETGVRANATLYSESGDSYLFGFEMSFPAVEYKLINKLGIPLTVKGTFPESYMWFRYQSKSGTRNMDVGLHFDMGSAFDRGLAFENFQPRISLSYPLWGVWKGKISYGRVTQNMITVNNEDDVISIFDAWIKIPRNLTAEVADHFVVGLDGNIVPEVSVDLQGYYKSFGTLIVYNKDKIDALDPDYTRGFGNAHGLEALVRYVATWMDIYASYTLSWTKATNGDLTFAPRYDRRHSLKLLTQMRPEKNLEVSVRWDYGSGFPFTQSIGYYDRLTLGDIFRDFGYGETGPPVTLLGPKNAARLPAYHRLDLSVNYSFSFDPIKGSVGLHLINAYDQKNVFYFDRKTGHQINMLSFFPSATLSLEY